MTERAISGPACRTFLAVVLAAAFLAPNAAVGTALAGTVAAASSADLPDVARALSRGASLRLEGAALEGRGDAAGLDLVRFEPVADGARFVVQAADGPHDAKPALPVYFRGAVDGMAGSVVVLSVHADGEMRGVVSSGDGTWMLSRGAKAGSVLRSRRAERDKVVGSRKFECETLPNPNPRRRGPVPSAPAPTAAAPAAAAPTSTTTPTASAVARLPVSYTAQVAVELDHEFYQTFAPDSDAAILYALDLIAFTGSIGESEFGMNTQVPFVQLWTTSSDPYSSGAARLGQVQARWNAPAATNCGGLDCTSIDRTTVLLLSSAPTGGVAYLPGMCDSWHYPSSGYAYAYAGSISGAFDLDAPSAVWDIMVTAHELGHSFGSEHSHCYSPAVDNCYGSESGCYAGPVSQPSGCPGNGQNCGTIMSYCHLLQGGMNNITLTYGAGFGYGVDPDRVPARMLSEIASEAANSPGCLSATDGMIELEVLKTGSGEGTITSSPSSIDCGTGCRTHFDAGTVVTLTATPGPFSQFTGWSGDADCSDGSVTMDAALSCVANFDGNCGAGNENCDDGDPCTEDSCPADDHCENLGVPRDPGLCLDASKTALKITNSADPAGDKMSWQWSSGEAFGQADLGDPSSATDYRLCFYDETGSVTSLAGSLWIPAGSSNWRNLSPKGWSWKDSAGAFDGIRKIQLKTGPYGMTKVKVSASGSSLALPAPYSGAELFDQDSAVTVQLFAGDTTCWSSSFSAAGTSLNSPTGFKARGG
jgi:hypothetical protein